MGVGCVAVVGNSLSLFFRSVEGFQVGQIGRSGTAHVSPVSVTLREVWKIRNSGNQEGCPKISFLEALCDSRPLRFPDFLSSRFFPAAFSVFLLPNKRIRFHVRLAQCEGLATQFNLTQRHNGHKGFF